MAHYFKRLRIWDYGMDIVDKVYLLTRELPDEEKYGLKSQMRRCAISIPSNIAEGAGKSSDKDFARFLEIALGSSYELETQLLICQRQKLLSDEPIELLLSLIDEEQRMLRNLAGKKRR